MKTIRKIIQTLFNKWHEEYDEIVADSVTIIAKLEAAGKRKASEIEAHAAELVSIQALKADAEAAKTKGEKTLAKLKDIFDPA